MQIKLLDTCSFDITSLKSSHTHTQTHKKEENTKDYN